MLSDRANHVCLLLSTRAQLPRRGAAPPPSGSGQRTRTRIGGGSLGVDCVAPPHHPLHPLHTSHVGFYLKLPLLNPNPKTVLSIPRPFPLPLPPQRALSAAPSGHPARASTHQHIQRGFTQGLQQACTYTSWSALHAALAAEGMHAVRTGQHISGCMSTASFAKGAAVLHPRPRHPSPCPNPSAQAREGTSPGRGARRAALGGAATFARFSRRFTLVDLGR